MIYANYYGGLVSRSELAVATIASGSQECEQYSPYNLTEVRLNDTKYAKCEKLF
jgi:hypothetical protein